jgi:hypothetical protein
VEQQGRVVAEQQQTNLAALSVKINKLASQQQEQQQQQQQQVEALRLLLQEELQREKVRVKKELTVQLEAMEKKQKLDQEENESFRRQFEQKVAEEMLHRLNEIRRRMAEEEQKFNDLLAERNKMIEILQAEKAVAETKMEAIIGDHRCQLDQLQQQQQQQQHQIVGLAQNNLAENVFLVDNKIMDLALLHSQSVSTLQLQLSQLSNSLPSLLHEQFPALLHQHLPQLLPPIQNNYQVVKT